MPINSWRPKNLVAFGFQLYNRLVNNQYFSITFNFLNSRAMFFDYQQSKQPIGNWKNYVTIWCPCVALTWGHYQMATKLFQSPNFLGAHNFWPTNNFTYIRGLHILYLSSFSFQHVRLLLFWTTGALHNSMYYFLLFLWFQCFLQNKLWWAIKLKKK